MNPIDAAIEICHIGLAAVALWLSWHCLWRKACQERFRQNLFDLRDELFDYARSGKIPFDDRAYVLLRCNINGMIRFSHLISVTRIFTFISLQRYIGGLSGNEVSLRAALSQVKGKEVKDALESFYGRMREATLKHMLIASPHILVLAPFLLLLHKACSKKDGVSQRPLSIREPAVDLIETQANEAFKSEAFKRHHERELASV
jgi:hypothetical protein